MDQINRCGKYRNVMITCNNYSIDDYNKFLNHEWFSYICIGKEIAPTTGTPHLQIYAELKFQKRIGALRREFPGSHILFARGSQQQCMVYCQKDDNWVERGTTCQPGRPQVDRYKIRELVSARVSLVEAYEQHDMTFNDVKFYEKVEQIVNFPKPPIREEREVIWICGDSGSGKTQLAQQLAGDDVFVKGGDKWWDGHMNEDTILLDDWRPSEYWRADRTLRILGGIRERVEVKGGSHWLSCKRIIITCCDRPEDIWEKNHSKEQVKQLLRRISKTYVCWVDQDRVRGNNKPEPIYLSRVET